jgi:WXXGXW repeat (2 copies)
MKKTMFSLALAGAMLAAFPAAAGARVFVRVAPPRAVVERPVRAPGRGYVWVGGYYRWGGHAYVWVPGRWAYPPRTAAVWVAPRWDYVPARHRYVFVAGFWR